MFQVVSSDSEMAHELDQLNSSPSNNHRNGWDFVCFSPDGNLVFRRRSWAVRAYRKWAGHRKTPYLICHPRSKAGMDFLKNPLDSDVYDHGYDFVGYKPNGLLVFRRRNWFARMIRCF